MITYTILDIAKRAGVSKSTVSRYINGELNKVSVKNQEKIAAVIQELDYHPNQVAIGLVKKRFAQIGVVVSDISNPFSAVIMKGIFDACAALDYKVSFANSDGDPERERQNIQNFLSFNVDYLIINTCGNNEKFLAGLDPRTTVIVDRPLLIDRFYTVTSDNRESAYAAVKMLQKKNVSLPIVFLTENIDRVITRQLRYEGYLQAVAQTQPPLLISYNDSKDAERQLAAIDQKFTKFGLFTVNGEALKVFLRFAKKQGIIIGRDVAVFSFEDWDWMELITPPISAVRQDSYGMGYRAAQHLLDGWLNENLVHRIDEMHAQIIDRQSSSLT